MKIETLRKYTILLIAALLCNGCLPYRFTTKPGACGTVLDAETKKGIQGANVTLTTYSFPRDKEKLETTTTQADGSFSIPAEQKWSIYIVPTDPARLKARISVEMEGYELYVQDFGTTTIGPAITKFKNILLKHVP